MDDLRKLRWTRGLVGLLVVVNLVTLGVMWFYFLRGRRPGPPPGGQGPGGEVQRFLTRELDLTPEQAAAFESLRDRFMSSMPAIPEEIQRLRAEMMNELFAPAPDEAKIERLAGEIGVRDAAMEKLLYGHFKDLISILTPAQRRKFQSIMNEFLKMIGPPPPPPPPGEKRPPKGPSEGPKGPGRQEPGR